MSASQPASDEESERSTQSGLDENVAGALAYVLGFLSGIVMFLIETENERVRFHAAQSMVVFGGIFVVSLVLGYFQAVFGFGNFLGSLFGAFFGLLSFLVSIAALILWIVLIVRTYQGRDLRIPVAADIADDIV